jgi:uncharacterized membrane protein
MQRDRGRDHQISRSRYLFDRYFLRILMVGVVVLARHWLLLLNTAGAIFLGLAFLAPILISLGLDNVGRLLFESYRITCHQEPERSFFIAGQQMAFCQRDTSIYGAILLGGLAFNGLRQTLRPLRWRYYMVFLTPMAVDGLTQLFGLRESTWELRLFTGVLFGLGTVWLLFPFIEETMVIVRRDAVDWLRQDLARSETVNESLERYE